MLSAICFNLDQSKLLSSGNELIDCLLPCFTFPGTVKHVGRDRERKSYLV